MGIFKKTDEQKKARQQKLDEFYSKIDESNRKEQDKNELKAREKAQKVRFDVKDAIYVFSGFQNNDDEKGTLTGPLGAIHNDRIVKCVARLLGNAQEEILIRSITSIETSKGSLPLVTIYASGNEMTFKVSTAIASRITSELRRLMTESDNINSDVDSISQLEKLAKLLEQGLVTREEFEKKKKDLLGL